MMNRLNVDLRLELTLISHGDDGREDGSSRGYVEGYVAGFSTGYRVAAGLPETSLHLTPMQPNVEYDDHVDTYPDTDEYKLGYHDGYMGTYHGAYSVGFDDGHGYYDNLYVDQSSVEPESSIERLDNDDLDVIDKVAFAQGFNNGLRDEHWRRDHHYDINIVHFNGIHDEPLTVGDHDYIRGVDFGRVNANDIEYIVMGDDDYYCHGR